MTRIYEKVFAGCTSLTNISLPQYIESVGVEAFKDCSSLTNVVINGNPTSLEVDIFTGCPIVNATVCGENPLIYYSFETASLKHVTINNLSTSVTSYFATYNVSPYDKIETVTINDSVKYIKNNAFTGCTNLNAVNFGSNSQLQTIGEVAFFETGLTSITIPKNVTTIQDSAFSNNTSLITINFSANTQSQTIGDQAFNACDIVNSLVINNNATTPITLNPLAFGFLGQAANTTTQIIINGAVNILSPGGSFAPFYGSFSTSPTVNLTLDGKYSLVDYGFIISAQTSPPSNVNYKTITINDASTSIADSFAFDGTTGSGFATITTLNIGSNVTSIGNQAFYLCTGLTSVVIPSSVISIGTDAFKGCSNITSLIINSPTVLINDGAFADCTKLTNVVISGIVTNVIGTIAFYYDASIKNLSLNGSTPLNRFRFNPLLSLTNLTVTGTTGYTTVSSRFTDGYKNTPIDMLTIEDGVITVASAAFQGCTGIKNLKIMPSIATIGAYAFSGCTGITSIDFDPPVDLTIADHAFEGNTSLTTLLLPEYVISIGDYSFANCTNLTTITIQNPNMFIGTNAFAGCTSLKTVNYCGPYTFGPGVTVICTSATLGSGATRGSSLTATANPVCFVKGTRILTMDGYVPIEKLKLNASLISKGRIVNGNFRADPNGCVAKKLKGIGNFKVDGNKKKNAPICIKKNAFFHNYPSRDLYVSADHGIIVGTKNVQAKDLINDDTIYRCSEFGEVEYFHVELDHHSAIIAENMPTESYLDVGNRNIFENWISVRQISKIGNIHSLRR